jgi:hypothetical protein
LRPPTFDRLREHLREKPCYYHILHFDSHGETGGRPLAVPISARLSWTKRCRSLRVS